MDQTASSKSERPRRSTSGRKLQFALDSNLGLTVDREPWPGILSAAGIETVSTDDLARLDEMVDDHQPDIAYIPAADYHRIFAKGDRSYRGLAIATSKSSGQPRLRSLLVVRRDDPAESLDDLEGAEYGYINKSCSSSYFPPAILLNQQGRKLNEFLHIKAIKPGPTWQGLVDGVVSGEVRATMILEDTWQATPENAKTTKVIGHYDGGTPAIVVVRDGLDESVCKTLLDALLARVPSWDDEVYGGFRPFVYADVHKFFHDLDALPAGM